MRVSMSVLVWVAWVVGGYVVGLVSYPIVNHFYLGKNRRTNHG